MQWILEAWRLTGERRGGVQGLLSSEGVVVTSLESWLLRCWNSQGQWQVRAQGWSKVWCVSYPSLRSLDQDTPAFYTVFSVDRGENSEPRNLRQSN